MTNTDQPAEFTNRVFDILADECGARESLRDEFRHSWPECVEFRFQGALGFGGKVFYSRRKVWVSCYSEDSTPEREAMIRRANERLAELVASKDALS